MHRTATQAIIDRQRQYFLSGGPREIPTRRAALEALRGAFVRHESLIIDAIHADMRRAALETFTMDIGMVLSDVEFALAHLNEWTTPTTVPVPEQPGARGRVYPEPYGVVLIQSAWNYPVMQLFGPLVGALAAGNTAVLRPAATSPHCTRAAAAIVADTFAPELVSCIVGPWTLTGEAIDASVDYVFFTGSPKVGRVIMERAARFLTPVTLEHALGAAQGPRSTKNDFLTKAIERGIDSRPPFLSNSTGIHQRRYRHMHDAVASDVRIHQPDRMRNLHSQLQQLAVNAWRAPQRILLRHRLNQVPDIRGDRWSPDASATLPRPEQAEALAMPGDDRLRQWVRRFQDAQACGKSSPYQGTMQPE